MSAKCPRCAALTDLTATNRWRPFCSERCRLIDLGAWADGSYRVPVHKPEPLPNLESGSEDDAGSRNLTMVDS